MPFPAPSYVVDSPLLHCHCSCYLQSHLCSNRKGQAGCISNRRKHGVSHLCSNRKGQAGWTSVYWRWFIVLCCNILATPKFHLSNQYQEKSTRGYGLLCTYIYMYLHSLASPGKIACLGKHPDNHRLSRLARVGSLACCRWCHRFFHHNAA